MYKPEIRPFQFLCMITSNKFYIRNVAPETCRSDEIRAGRSGERHNKIGELFQMNRLNFWTILLLAVLRQASNASKLIYYVDPLVPN